MKQHLAKSLLMAGAMIASYPLLAQQSQPMQSTQPMPAAQTMQPMQPTQSAPSAQAMPSAQPMQAMPAATSPTQAAAPVAGDPYAQAAAPVAQAGMAPADPTLVRSTDPSIDPASMSLPPDALGTRLGQRSPFLDGA
ncbi:hypothetical protein J5T34_03555 [Cupriavidus gilardii]|uniref:hypothetical protein n=1 Tax=Cupriavidus gilardii TaxID=82541 RepID=UPI001ABE46DD|nr:hypothetical protein [Cupriavidus gilardii]MBO4119814.1 hypothetical protein [Cupriavidus gilardii]